MVPNLHHLLKVINLGMSYCIAALRSKIELKKCGFSGFLNAFTLLLCPHNLLSTNEFISCLSMLKFTKRCGFKIFGQPALIGTCQVLLYFNVYLLLGAYQENRPEQAISRVQVGKIVERSVPIKCAGWNIFEK